MAFDATIEFSKMNRKL